MGSGVPRSGWVVPGRSRGCLLLASRCGPGVVSWLPVWPRSGLQPGVVPQTLGDLGVTSSSFLQIIYDIGTRFLIFHCFATKMLLLFCKSMIPVRFCTILPLHSCADIKTRLKAPPANPGRSLFEKCFKSRFDTARL